MNNDAPTFATDGKTPVYNRAGVGLVVPAVAFNQLHTQYNMALELLASQSKAREEAQDEYQELKQILKDLCDLNSEGWAIGGGPGYKERFAKAWKRAHEIFEP